MCVKKLMLAYWDRGVDLMHVFSGHCIVKRYYKRSRNNRETLWHCLIGYVIRALPEMGVSVALLIYKIINTACKSAAGKKRGTHKKVQAPAHWLAQVVVFD